MTRHTPPVIAYRRARRHAVLRDLGTAIGTRMIRNVVLGCMVLVLPMVIQYVLIELGVADYVVLP